MSNMRQLRDCSAPYKGISVAHDMPPWQREEIKTLVAEAKETHVNTSNEPLENYWFRVVGLGSKMRVVKVQKP